MEGVDLGGEDNLQLQMMQAEVEELSEEKRIDFMQKKLIRMEEDKARQTKARNSLKETRRKQERDADMFIEGQPTEMAYLIAQALAHLAAIFHPDPDNPPTVRGFLAEIETTDDIPVRARAKKLADIQKAYLRAMAKKLITQGK
jgi:hypothetical protein